MSPLGSGGPPIVVTVGFLLVDVLIIGRRPHEPSTREVTRDLIFYIGAAILFGIGVWVLRRRAVRR